MQFYLVIYVIMHFDLAILKQLYSELGGAPLNKFKPILQHSGYHSIIEAYID